MFFFKARRTWRQALLDAVVNLAISITNAETRIMATVQDLLDSVATIKTHQAAQSAALAKLQTDTQTAIAMIQNLKANGGATPGQLDQVAAALSDVDAGVTSATTLQTNIDGALADAVAPPAPAPAPTPAPAPADAGSPAAPPSDNPPADPATGTPAT